MVTLKEMLFWMEYTFNWKKWASMVALEKGILDHWWMQWKQAGILKPFFELVKMK